MPATTITTTTTTTPSNSRGSKGRERGATITTLAVGPVDQTPNGTAAANSLTPVISEKNRSSSSAALKKIKTTGSRSAPNTPGSIVAMSSHRRMSSASESATDSSESIDLYSDPGVLDRITLGDIVFPTGVPASTASPSVLVQRAYLGDPEHSPSLVVKICKGIKLQDASKSEIEALRDMHHPNLVQYYTIGEKSGDVWVRTNERTKEP